MSSRETQRKRGRTSRESRTERPERVPVGGFRDKLTVQKKDPNKNYRWVVDTDHTGTRILQFIQGGYEFTPAESVVVGQTYVFSAEQTGDIIRVPANKQGDYLYLMEIPKDIYDNDAKAKQQLVNQTEEALYNPEHLQQDIRDGGLYGGIKIS